MIDTPQITQSTALQTAVIRLTIPRAEIQQVMGPAIGEVMTVIAAQTIDPAGPVFSHHFKMDPATFDFEVGVPVNAVVAPSGRVEVGQLPATKVARTIYHGPYDGLGAAWSEFHRWIAANGHQPAADLWECYVSGPESTADPAEYHTELNQPLID